MNYSIKQQIIGVRGRDFFDDHINEVPKAIAITVLIRENIVNIAALY